MNIHQLVVGPLGTNCYILADEDNKGIVIDPGADGDTILSLLAREKIELQEIWLTHAHYDHIGAIADLKRVLPLVLRVFHTEADWLGDPMKNFSVFLGDSVKISAADKMFEGGEELGFGGLRFKVLHTPGHTPGSVCFYHEKGILFSGDTLFAGSVGRTDLPGGSYEQIITSIRQKLLCLPGGTKVYPGHGDTTLIATEIRENPFLEDEY